MDAGGAASAIWSIPFACGSGQAFEAPLLSQTAPHDEVQGFERALSRFGRARHEKRHMDGVVLVAVGGIVFEIRAQLRGWQLRSKERSSVGNRSR